jgi:hypothetical protein
MSDQASAPTLLRFVTAIAESEQRTPEAMVYETECDSVDEITGLYDFRRECREVVCRV